MFERQPARRQNIVSIPQPEKGVFKRKEELLSPYLLQSGKVSVYDSDTQTPFIRIEPEMNDRTLGIINASISARPDISNVRRHSMMVGGGLPSVHMVLDRGVQFWFENHVVAGIDSNGFNINKSFFDEEPEIKALEYIEPQTPTSMHEFRFTRQQSTMDSEEFDHLVTVSFRFKTDDHLMLNSLMAGAIVRSAGNYELLRSVVNTEINIRSVNTSGDDDLGGEGTLFGAPTKDDGGTGGVLV